MIQTLHPARSRASSGASSLAASLPMLRCMQPGAREGSQSPTTPRHMHSPNVRMADEYIGSGSWLGGQEQDTSPRASRPSSFHPQMQRAALPSPRFAPYDSLGRHSGRMAEHGRLLGPEPTVHPTLVSIRLMRAQLDDQWRAAMPAWAALGRTEVLTRVAALTQAKATFLAGCPAEQHGDIERLVRAAASEHPGRLGRLARTLEQRAAAAPSDERESTKGLAAELAASLSRIADDFELEREMPAAKRRFVWREPPANATEELKRSQADVQSDMRQELRALERMVQLTSMLLPQARCEMA